MYLKRVYLRRVTKSALYGVRIEIRQFSCVTRPVYISHTLHFFANPAYIFLFRPESGAAGRRSTRRPSRAPGGSLKSRPRLDGLSRPLVAGQWARGAERGWPMEARRGDQNGNDGGWRTTRGAVGKGARGVSGVFVGLLLSVLLAEAREGVARGGGVVR